jgi:putative transcriptional regulator
MPARLLDWQRRRNDNVIWNMRLVAAEQGIWKSSELRARFIAAGLDISAGKMSTLWTQNPTTVRLEDLDVICAVLNCTPSDLLVAEPSKAIAESKSAITNSASVTKITPRLGRNRTTPPA